GISVSSNDTLAHRIYKTTRNGVCIELLNDATIAARAEYDVHQSVALACDVQRWWDASASRPVAAFCCVNRGIIIDELHSLSESSSDVEDFARTVLEWLASPEFDVAKQLGGVPEGAKCDFGDHYRECRFRLDGRFVRLSAIS